MGLPLNILSIAYFTARSGVRGFDDEVVLAIELNSVATEPGQNAETHTPYSLASRLAAYETRKTNAFVA